jgi:hypothetical protein
MSQVSICYPAPRGPHPLTGKRVTDLPRADGRRLYQALRHGRFLLAASGGATASTTSGYGDRVDTATVARASGGVDPPRRLHRLGGGRPAGQSVPEICGALARWCGT